MSTTMLSICGGAYAHVADAVGERHERFCGTHGFAYKLLTEKLRDDRNWSWNKLPAILEAFRAGADTVVWCDADCLPVPGSRPFEILPNRPLQISMDATGNICCGFMVITREAIPLIEAWNTLGPLMDARVIYRDRDMWEQSTLMYLRRLTYVWNVISLIPQDVVANPQTRRLKRLPVFYHAWKHGTEAHWIADTAMIEADWGAQRGIFQ